jgi:anthranilate phosphoribosyltransferase
VRKLLAAQGRRSVFNILGPLINPGRPAHILLGVYSLSLVEKLALTLDELGQPAGLVGHGIIGEGKGIDEITTATPNRVQGVGRLREVRGTWGVETFGLATSPFDDLKGGDVAANLAMVETILGGRAPAGLVDTIVLNAALGLFITGRTKAIQDGIVPLRELLLDGAVKAKIAATKEFYRA